MKPTMFQSIKRIKIGDTFVVHTPHRDFKYRVIGLYSQSRVKDGMNTYQVERVLN